MTTRLTEESNERMTPQEAEAILELWAKRQGENPRATVGDLAEAMSIQPAEVSAMLQEIRRDPNRSEEMRQKRNRNRIWIAIGAVGAAVWLICVAAFLGHFLAKRGRGNTVIVGTPAPVAEVVMDSGPVFEKTAAASIDQNLPVAPPNPTAMASEGAYDFEKHLPKGVTVDFDGYSVEGTSSFTQLSEEQVYGTLQDIVSHVAKVPSSTIEEPLNESLIQQAFLDTSDAYVKNLLRFKEIEVAGPASKITTKVPVAIVSNPTLDRLIREEQARRLVILANQLLRMGRTKLSR